MKKKMTVKKTTKPAYPMPGMAPKKMAGKSKKKM